MHAFSAFVRKPLNIFFESQESNEEILYLLRRHFITNVRWIFFAVIMLLCPIILMNFFFRFNVNTTIAVPLRYQYFLLLIWYLITAAFILESFLNWYFNVYIVTSKRIVDIDFWGIFYKNVSETDYAHVEDVTYTMGGFLQTLFNFGTITVQTAAEKREFEFDGIPNPSEVYDKITDLAQVHNKHGNDLAHI